MSKVPANSNRRDRPVPNVPAPEVQISESAQKQSTQRSADAPPNPPRRHKTAAKRKGSTRLRRVWEVSRTRLEAAHQQQYQCHVQAERINQLRQENGEVVPPPDAPMATAESAAAAEVSDGWLADVPPATPTWQVSAPSEPWTEASWFVPPATPPISQPPGTPPTDNGDTESCETPVGKSGTARSPRRSGRRGWRRWLAVPSKKLDQIGDALLWIALSAVVRVATRAIVFFFPPLTPVINGLLFLPALVAIALLVWGPDLGFVTYYRLFLMALGFLLGGRL